MQKTQDNFQKEEKKSVDDAIAGKKPAAPDATETAAKAAIVANLKKADAAVKADEALAKAAAPAAEAAPAAAATPASAAAAAPA